MESPKGNVTPKKRPRGRKNAWLAKGDIPTTVDLRGEGDGGGITKLDEHHEGGLTVDVTAASDRFPSKARVVSPNKEFVDKGQRDGSAEVKLKLRRGTREGIVTPSPLLFPSDEDPPITKVSKSRKNLSKDLEPRRTRRSSTRSNDGLNQKPARAPAVVPLQSVVESASESESKPAVIEDIRFESPQRARPSSTYIVAKDEDLAPVGTFPPKPGRPKPIHSIPPNVRAVYTIINKRTGKIGGNGSGGPIYGETTSWSMHKMVQLMKKHTGLSRHSRFIDVGSGLGKPNLHVAQDPGVQFSFGIELEEVRWMLGMHNLKFVLSEAKRQQQLQLLKEEKDEEEEREETLRSAICHRCTFALGNITEANTLDPFTHVYMFDIGFPPKLFLELAEMFNRSQSEYLICYHSPRLIIDRYGFDVDFVVQMNTAMHGSSENHMGYIYRRRNRLQRSSRQNMEEVDGVSCDPLFAPYWRAVRSGLEPLYDSVCKTMDDKCGAGQLRSGRRRGQGR